jgi:hypothetical protein
MKNFKFFICLNIILLILSSCGTIKDGFENKKKNSTDEFLVEKKSPLVMPPSFEELPVPSNQKITQENQTNSIKSLITDKKISDEKIINAEADKDFEKSILDKIKNN